jgi:Protein of unknown function (DUF2490)
LTAGGPRGFFVAMKFAAALGIFVALSAWALPGSADEEAWFWVENRVPVIRTEKPGYPRIDIRTFADVRLNNRSNGLAQSFLRVGPLFYLTNFLFVGVHGTIYADRLPTGVFDQETRFEVEPNFFGRLGPFTWNDRNRFEFRYRSEETRYRYRNQLRINLAPKSWRTIPFVWDEVLVELSGLGLNQNRAEIGIGRQLAPNIRLDAGFMIRSREDATGWHQDGVLNLYLFVDVPSEAKKK